MNRLKSFYAYLCGSNFAYALVLALVVKAIVSDINYATFLLTIPILSYESYKLYIKTKTPDAVALDAELRKELDQIKAKVNATTLGQGISGPAPVKRYF